MCGRIAQTSPFQDYVETIRWNPHALLDSPAGKRFNIPPGTHPAVLHRLDGIEAMARLHWGYKPVWLKRGPFEHGRHAIQFMLM